MQGQERKDHIVSKLLNKIDNANPIVKIWSQIHIIPPHLVGHKLKEFSPTRTLRGHWAKKQRNRIM